MSAAVLLGLASCQLPPNIPGHDGHIDDQTDFMNKSSSIKQKWDTQNDLKSCKFTTKDLAYFDLDKLAGPYIQYVTFNGTTEPFEIRFCQPTTKTATGTDKSLIFLHNQTT